MMAQRHFGRAQFRGESIEVAAAETGTERAGGLAFRNQPFDHGIGIARFNVKGYAAPSQVFG